MVKKKNPFISNRSEIFYNLINSGIAGTLVFLGSIADGDLTIKGIAAAFIASMIVLFTKFQSYWKTQEKEYKCKILNFL